MEITHRGIVRAVFVLAATIAVMNCAGPSSVRTFPGPGCPRGWNFLYQDQMSRNVMCRQDSTGVTAKLR